MKNVLLTIIALVFLSCSNKCFAEETEQIKIFTNYSNGGADRASAEVQKEVNAWLKTNKNAIITQRHSSVAGGGSGGGTFVVSITIFYKK
ncbi:MAG: hypothetical protein HGA36_05390 [Candidatus Moranbacteria bacterium]|nr:hypothetical protein [Candidatus Moranbacteria bacterium]